MTSAHLLILISIYRLWLIKFFIRKVFNVYIRFISCNVLVFDVVEEQVLVIPQVVKVIIKSLQSLVLCMQVHDILQIIFRSRLLHISTKGSCSSPLSHLHLLIRIFICVRSIEEIISLSLFQRLAFILILLRLFNSCLHVWFWTAYLWLIGWLDLAMVFRGWSTCVSFSFSWGISAHFSWVLVWISRSTSVLGVLLLSEAFIG